MRLSSFDPGLNGNTMGSSVVKDCIFRIDLFALDRRVLYVGTGETFVR